MSQVQLMDTKKVVVERQIGGEVFRIETGELAKQAAGAVLCIYGETVVLVTACCNDKPRKGASFFPLTVDYEEKMYSAGKIPGGWIKREGRPPERATLTARLIDRPIRPLFPEGFRNEVHVVGMCLSVDGVNDPDVIALCGAGAALSISHIPFEGPVAGVRVGYVDGEFVINPTQDELSRSLLDLVVAGTRDNIMMVEAGACEVSEDLLLDAFEEGHAAIKVIIDMIEELVAKAGKPKRDYPFVVCHPGIEAAVRRHFGEKIAAAMRLTGKQERSQAMEEINKEALIAALQEEAGGDSEELIALLSDDEREDFSLAMKKIQREELVTMVVKEGRRPDGRKFDEIRPLSAEVGKIPRTHGSGLFTRGETQVLSLVTLGTLSEEQNFDNVIGEESRRYMHHYNFPPFSVGEARFMRGPGRREIGHGALAERALLPVIPPEEEFPYTIRVVSECLESNGSTSMASTCGSTLSLMDAGVPIVAPVGGIAMGLVMDDEGNYRVLTDIQGVEDHLGEMDFKVAGTREGVTALQMDIKMKGITKDILKVALEQAKVARMQILDVIEQTIPAPREELSPWAPRIKMIRINPENIKDVIGPGGRTINRIIADTNVKIDIESDGRVYVASTDREALDRAVKMIEDLLHEVEPGEIYTGKVMRLMNFGAFVEILPGKEGLLHISKIKPWHVDNIEDVVGVGDELEVKVEEIDALGRINLTRRGIFTEDEQREAANHTPPGGFRNDFRQERSKSYQFSNNYHKGGEERGVDRGKNRRERFKGTDGGEQQYRRKKARRRRRERADD